MKSARTSPKMRALRYGPPELALNTRDFTPGKCSLRQLRTRVLGFGCRNAGKYSKNTPKTGGMNQPRSGVEPLFCPLLGGNPLRFGVNQGVGQRAERLPKALTHLRSRPSGRNARPFSQRSRSRPVVPAEHSPLDENRTLHGRKLIEPGAQAVSTARSLCGPADQLSD